MTKTVLQVVQHLKPGGIETMALDLQQHLSGCDVHIVSLEGTADEALPKWSRLQNRQSRLRFLNKRPGFSFLTLFKLIYLIKKLNVHAIHTHHIGPLTYGGLAARLCGIKHLVHTEHDAWHLQNAKAAKLERRLLRYLKPALVADCHMVAQKLRDLDDLAKPHVIYNGIDTDRFSPAQPEDKRKAREQLNLPTDVPLIGCAARLEKVKGLKYLIKAMSYMPKDACLAIAGDGGFMTRLKEQAASHASGQRIFFLGRVEKMECFYKAIDLFCLPSLNEGFPLSPLEAQACDIPAVITDVGGAKETLCPQTGLLVPPQDAHSLQNALEKKLYGIRSHRPSQFVKEHADIKQMTSAYANLLAI